MIKTVLITGGNKGIGLEVTRLFLETDYKILVIARDFANFIYHSNENVQTVKFDLTEVGKIPKLIEELGEIDILINNAGIMRSYTYDDYPQDKVDESIKLNIEAPVTLIQEVSKGMLTKGAGRIVNNASIAGQIGHPDIWYGITKAGLINATKSFAKILGPHGIIINAVAPGPVQTEMFKCIPESRKLAIKNSVYSGRFAKPLEVAKTIFWLATDSPEYINGTCVDINNGAFPR